MRKRFIPENIPKFLFYRIYSFIYYLIELVFPPQIVDYKEIPIIINNFNRLDTLKKLIGSLEKRGYKNIYIIDNLSTYPPLLEYYKSCIYKIFYLNKNIGMNAFWISGIYKEFRNNFFVYTDSDVVPVEECPDDFLLFFLKSLKSHKLARKVGFSLKIDDIPDCYALKDRVIRWEEHFFNDFIREDMLYWAPIDTTFALYRPRGKRKHANNNIEMYRTAYPYMARHLPWYIDSKNPDDENRYYIEHSKVTTYWTKEGKGLLDQEEEKRREKVTQNN
jgi:hypothetical protein